MKNEYGTVLPRCIVRPARGIYSREISVVYARLLYVLSIVIPLGACASPTDIFKRQNAMTHNIALAGVEAERMGDQSRIESLTQAEEEIDNACGPLQEAGATRL